MSIGFGVYSGMAKLCGWYSEKDGECRELALPGWGYCKHHKAKEGKSNV